jgi:cyclopropane-fatty-acyl-phospholipid synthase
VSAADGYGSAIYEVEIAHQRSAPIGHGFRYHSYQWLVDLSALPRIPRGLGWLARFNADDHLRSEPGTTILDRVLSFLSRNDIDLGGGTVLMLANARSFGYVFNPISVYWCLDSAGVQQCVIAEVHNTYGGQHAYLLHPDDSGTARAAKELYVSPFYPVDGEYQLSLPRPDDRLAISIILRRDSDRPFVATMRGKRSPATTRHLLRAAVRNPLSTLVVSARIRRQGIALYLRGLRPFARPSIVSEPTSTHGVDAMSRKTKEIDVSDPSRSYIDPEFWPDVARVPADRVRARIARTLFRAATARLALRVGAPDTPVRGAGGPDSPVFWLNRPDDFYRRVGATGLVGFGEAYQAGDWEAEDLAGVLTVFAHKMDTLIPPWLQGLRKRFLLTQPSSEDNTVDGARNNIHRHYDLSNDLFTLFLDESMTYSSGLFEGPPASSVESLTSAQHRKIDRLLDQAGVTEGSRVLEIGSGWGELAIRAAQRGAKVVTITISTEQQTLAQERVEQAGLSDLVEVRLCDYREVEGEYDAVVSVEMIEAVGANHWRSYFTTIDRVLVPGGRVGIQAITMPHDRMVASMNTYTWIRKYIFPGGQLASVEAIEEQVANHTSLRLDSKLSFGGHYAETLRRWRDTFEAKASDVDALGFDQTFRRMWSLYLAYSEAGFRSGYLDVYQFTFHKPQTIGQVQR